MFHGKLSFVHGLKIGPCAAALRLFLVLPLRSFVDWKGISADVPWRRWIVFRHEVSIDC